MDVIPTWAILVFIIALLTLAGGLAFWLYEYISSGGQSDTKSTAKAIASHENSETDSKEQELLRVSRTQKGELAVFVLGQQYSHLREIKDRHVGAEAVAAVKAVTLFAKGWLPALRKGEEEPTGTEPSVDPETFLKQLQSADLFPRETSRSPGLFGQNRPSASPDPVESLSTPADELNKLIEERVNRYPQLQKHHIHLTTNPDGSLCFHVGLHTFNSPEEITNPQIRAFVQDTIRKWNET